MIFTCPGCKRALAIDGDGPVIEGECPICARPFSIHSQVTGHGDPPSLTDRLLVRLSLAMACHLIFAVFAAALAASFVYENRSATLFFAVLVLIVGVLDLALNQGLANVVFDECRAMGNPSNALHWRGLFLRSLGFAGLRHLNFDEVWIHCLECERMEPVHVSVAGRLIECECGNAVRVDSAFPERFFGWLQRFPESVISAVKGIFKGIFAGVVWVLKLLFSPAFLTLALFRWAWRRGMILRISQREWSGAVFHRFLEIRHGKVAPLELCLLFKRSQDEEEHLLQLAKNYLTIMNVGFVHDERGLRVDELELHNVHLEGFADYECGTGTTRLTG